MIMWVISIKYYLHDSMAKTLTLWKADLLFSIEHQMADLDLMHW